MSGFLKLFGGGKRETVPRLPGPTQAEKEIVDEFSEDEARAEITYESSQDALRLKRPPAFTENTYPPIPEAREFSTAEVWDGFSVSEAEQENVGRAQQLLSGLPPETRRTVKRQIVDAAFNAFGVSIEDIVSASSNEIDALRHYIADANERAERFKTVSEERIVELEIEIERIRHTIRDGDGERERLVGSALEVIEEVEPVLEFFGNQDGEKSRTLPPPTAAEALVASLPPRTDTPVASSTDEADSNTDEADFNETVEGDDTVVGEKRSENTVKRMTSAPPPAG